MELHSQHEHGNFILKTYHEEHPLSPRELYDSRPTIVTWYKECFEEEGSKVYGTPNDFSAYAKKHGYHYLPVFGYSHGGLTIATTPFNCPWDSGFIGFVYITPDQLKAWQPTWKNLTKKRRESIKEWLKADVNLWDDYFNGRVYGFTITESHEEYEKEIDSLWGIYGNDYLNHITVHFEETGEVLL